ncbi:hypothetical protein N752_13200 [Desulforamulus aquiferis]|nr:hypothetical protein N752_13200 [Desulforamulus aquiferis]
MGRLRMAMVEGDIQDGSVMAGQVCGMVKKIEPAADIIQDIVSGAEQVMSRFSRGEF